MKKSRNFSKDRSEINTKPNDNNRDTSNIRDKSSDNFALQMQKLMSENRDIKDPINVIQAKNINRTKKISYDKNDRPPRTMPNQNGLNINGLNLNTKSENLDSILSLIHI